MRSSIACVRCRRSKIKCVNNGVDTVCRACENSGRDCQYPPPLTTGVRPRESFSNEYGTADGRPKAKKRPQASAGNDRDSLRPLFDALDPRVLTATVWQELYELFQIHYSADLPFLHPSSFLKPLRQASHQQTADSPSTEGAPLARPPMGPEFLLAFLSLTARFHPRLVAHHSPAMVNRMSNPLIASDYYAAAATERLSGIFTNDGTNQDIERIQALLMLGLHEWGMCRGAKAWLVIGVAIRSAQAMGLQYELDLDDEPLSRALPLDSEADGDAHKAANLSTADDADAFINQEIRRRTFWSCYIMDRYLSSGKYRPQMLHAKELRIQLPVSERSFLFAEKVRTLMLGEEQEGVAGRAEVESLRRASVMIGAGNSPEPTNPPSPRTTVAQEGGDDVNGRLESGEEEGLVSRYVRVLEIYGNTIRWSCAGGRRTEKYPPWDPRSEFFHLRRQCMEFKASLPRQHTLTRQNTQAHISLKTSTPYMLVHTVYLLCQISLHREYVPFVPIRCHKPEGPLDPPLFPPEKYDVPPTFWADSARECFKAARELMDLISNCQEWGALVETPIVGFAIYNVAFVGVYCINFPWMDPNGYMCTRASPDKDHTLNDTKPGESKGFEAARKSLQMIGQMRKKINMADGWFKTINRMHRYFRRMKSDYRKNVTAMDSASEHDGSPHATRHVSLREGGLGGGLDEFRMLERVLKEFGNLEDQDVELAQANRRPTLRPYDAVYDDSRSGTSVKSEDPEHKAPAQTEPPPRSDNGPWNAINAAPPTSKGQFRSYEYYNQTYQPTPAQPQPDLQPSEAQQIPHFRPVNFQPDTQSVPIPAPDPDLTSPNDQSLPTPSQPSPHFEGPPQRFSNPWPSQIPMQPPAAPYGTFPSPQQQQQQQQQTTPIQAAAPYPTPTVQRHPQPWDAMQKEAWLNSLDTRLGGDDFVAFADGGDMAEWALMSANRGYGGGWLSTVWGDGAVS